jgi:hypothetical protein
MGMSEFVIDSGEENSYSLAAPKGVKAEQLAISKWQLAGKPKKASCDPLPAGIPPIHAQKRRANGARLGLGHAWVALGWPLGGPWVALG